MKKSILLCLFCALVLVSCGKKDGFVSEKAKYDLEVVKLDIGQYILKDFYNPEPLDQLENDLIHKNLSRDEAIIRLSKILSEYNVCHLKLHINDPEFYSESAPLVVNLFEDDYYIIGIEKQYEKYLGCKLIELGGYPIKEAVEKYRQYFSYETPSSSKYVLENGINFKILRDAGMLDKKGRLPVTIKSTEGMNESITLKSCNLNQQTDFSFISVNAATSIRMNRNKRDCVSVVADADKKTIYYQTFAFGSSSGRNENYAETFDQLIKQLESGNYNTVVFDMRYNPGGDNTQYMFESLVYKNKEILQKHNLAVVTSGNTYSASVMFINYLYGQFPDLKFFGEETGQRIFHYTQVTPETLPNLKCNIIFPRVTEGLDNVAKRATDLTRGIMPDVEVHQTFDDFINGQDTIYKAIWDYYN